MTSCEVSPRRTNAGYIVINAAETIPESFVMRETPPATRHADKAALKPGRPVSIFCASPTGRILIKIRAATNTRNALVHMVYRRSLRFMDPLRRTASRRTWIPLSRTQRKVFPQWDRGPPASLASTEAIAMISNIPRLTKIVT